MNILKIIFFNLASLSIAISITSCQNNSVNEPYVSKFDRSSSSPVQSSSPVVYDVICFPQSGLLTTGVSCQPENIFKVPRGTKVTAYLQTVTSVQQGSNINTSFTTDTKSDEEKISVSEMESLSLKDAKIYVVTREVGGRFDLFAVRILLFNKDSGKFDIFAQGEFQKLGEDTSKSIFTTGDTDIRYIPNSIPEAPSSSNNYSPTQNSTHPSAAKFVEIYYRSLNERNYKNAWSRLSTNFQRKSQDYKQWWDKVANIKVDNIQNISSNDDVAVVQAKIIYELKDGRIKKDENKQIHLIWNKIKNEWEIDE